MPGWVKLVWLFQHRYQRERRKPFVGRTATRLYCRTFLKDAPIILLDEATASLDAENETKIQAGISELVQGKTVIIIAHRMRTVCNADHIVVLNGGTVSETAPRQVYGNKW